MILNGNYSPEEIDEITHLLITNLRKKTDTVLNGIITTDQFVGKIKKWDERTSTSPSGLHLGHYHALWRHSGLSTKNPLRETIELGQSKLIEARVSLLNYALRFGYSYERWRNVVNVMLTKDPGKPRIHRLRVIHLYEADYNLLLAIKWREGIHHAEDKKLLHEGMYGSRPGRSAMDPVLMETWQNEIYQCSMKKGITC